MYHSSAHCAILNPFLTNVVSRLLWIAQLIPLSTGWQTSEVLRIIFAIAIQLLQPKQTWWFASGCSHIFFSCISHRNCLPVLFKWASFLGQDLARWRKSASASLQTLTWAWQIHPLEEQRTSSSSIWDLSVVNSSRTSGISAIQLAKICHASQPDFRWCMQWFIAASGQEDESDHSTRSSAYHGGICAQLPGKACAAIWRNASSRFSGSLENRSCVAPSRITATLEICWNN